MAITTRERGVGLSPFLTASNVIVWISAVIVMGIVSYFISTIHGAYYPGDHLVYDEVISVLTVAFFLAAFFLGSYPGHVLLFNLIFSYLWLVAVVFAVQDYNYGNSALQHTVEAFSFIAFFFLFFNVLYSWYLSSYRVGGRHTTAVV
ncbi:hypothetical protein B0T17DRAFT_498053 [Bombardia bombarda]|uniref:MARVEL domain-containing protein n=1 Tax=Bombardia bombarda TaxID=252184 RepID=A0AA40BVH4_9PEZI|nr:hypothetical protein B0T17DRAFT_498053 [Bombardia bombarda]